jgi:hypothetical protein
VNPTAEYLESAIAQARAEGALQIDDLLDEESAANHVRVIKYEARRSRENGHIYRVKTFDEMSTNTLAHLPALARKDNLRMLAGKKPVFMDEVVRRLLGGELVSVTPNLRTDVGKDFAANSLAGVQPSQADWIALSNNNGGASASHTGATLPWSTAEAADAAASGTRGEYTALGLARKVTTYAHTVNTTSYTLTATWTASSAITSVQLAGNFGGSTKNTQGSSATTNILFLENTFTATSLAASDQLQLTWTVNV